MAMTAEYITNDVNDTFRIQKKLTEIQKTLQDHATTIHGSQRESIDDALNGAMQYINQIKQDPDYLSVKSRNTFHFFSAYPTTIDNSNALLNFFRSIELQIKNICGLSYRYQYRKTLETARTDTNNPQLKTALEKLIKDLDKKAQHSEISYELEHLLFHLQSRLKGELTHDNFCKYLKESPEYRNPKLRNIGLALFAVSAAATITLVTTQAFNPLFLIPAGAGLAAFVILFALSRFKHGTAKTANEVSKHFDAITESKHPEKAIEQEAAGEVYAAVY